MLNNGMKKKSMPQAKKLSCTTNISKKSNKPKPIQQEKQSQKWKSMKENDDDEVDEESDVDVR